MPQLDPGTFTTRHPQKRALWTQSFIGNRAAIPELLARMVDEFARGDWTLETCPMTENIGTKRKPDLMHGERYVLEFATNADLQRVALALFGVTLERTPETIECITITPNIGPRTLRDWRTYLEPAQAA